MSNYKTCNSYIAWVKEHLGDINKKYGHHNILNLNSVQKLALFDEWVAECMTGFDKETYNFISRISTKMLSSGMSYDKLKMYLSTLEFNY